MHPRMLQRTHRLAAPLLRGIKRHDRCALAARRRQRPVQAGTGAFHPAISARYPGWRLATSGQGIMPDSAGPGPLDCELPPGRRHDPAIVPVVAPAVAIIVRIGHGVNIGNFGAGSFNAEPLRRHCEAGCRQGSQDQHPSKRRPWPAQPPAWHGQPWCLRGWRHPRVLKRSRPDRLLVPPRTKLIHARTSRARQRGRSAAHAAHRGADRRARGSGVA